MYTQEQQLSIYTARNRLIMEGRPEVKAKIDYMVANEVHYDEIWKVAMADIAEVVKPERPGEVIAPPPFMGKGSSTEMWRNFALKVSDMEPEVIGSMSRSDIISVLIQREIIPAPDFEMTGVQA